MSIQKNKFKQTLHKALTKKIASNYSSKKADLVSQFAKYFCSSMSVVDLEKRDFEQLYQTIVSLWDYLQASKYDCDVRVYTPQVKKSELQHSVIEIIHSDMPFLVDSVRMELNRLGVNIRLHIHIPLNIEKSAKNSILSMSRPNSDKDRATVTPMYIEIDRQLDDSELELIKSNLEEVLSDVRVTVSDWKPMKKKLAEVIKRVEELPKSLMNEKNQESYEFINWIMDNHFTLLGYSYYELKKTKGGERLIPKKSSCLGLKTKVNWAPKPYYLKDLSKGAQELILTNENILVLTKLSSISRVHRPAHIDHVGIKRVNSKGEVIGEDRFIGLYTSAAYNLNPMNIPVLRRRIQLVKDRTGLTKHEHNYKVLKNILETYPRDELFQISVDKLYEISTGILHIQERPIIRLFVRQDPYGRFFSCLVYVPREIYNTRIRVKITQVLTEEFGIVSESRFTTTFSESNLARIHFLFPVDNTEEIKYDVKAIENKLFEVTRSWKDNLKDLLLQKNFESENQVVIKDFLNAFPVGYQDDSSVEMALKDIQQMQSLTEANSLAMSLYQLDGEQLDNKQADKDCAANIRFKLFYKNEPKPLSDVLPMLENMGLNIIGTKPYRVKPVNQSSEYWINEFVMQRLASEPLNLKDVKDKFQEAFTHIWFEEAENDGFNRLVLSAELNWKEVAILRAYSKYMWQIGSSFSQHYVEETLDAYPNIARLLVQYFFQKFDPQQKQSKKKEEKLRDKILNALDKVSNLDQDRILHRYLELMQVTLRTNFFQLDEHGKDKSYIALKLESSLITDIPKPAPMFEVFVYSPRIEGVHLRGGKVARGGLRWSDRREDFRTEILGLVKAQQVKNSVIVPVGAKGGFVCKRNLSELSREEFLKEGVHCYKIFISALLDITDNLIKGKLVPPKQVVRHDEDDPYLVVAADKGTATFSDIANEISNNYGFWLGDAFASGGSIGYDHKKMGITAKGAWESVKRHFMEMGVNCQTTDFTVVGVGDMAGDVFGNGMLCSKHIKLVAAFNHMHIFIDPKPNSEKSYQERKRLFYLPRSSWTDYNAKLISKGGGIFERSAKVISLTPEIKTLLNTDKNSLTPNQLISALLKSEVDLLWNGGIGTYVKAKSETHADVGDRANDNLRVNGEELRCKVIGEGGNLGVTQLGRIEYMLNGGRGNSDFIDNAGGVNCSDNEVNIKVLLNQIVTSGDMSKSQRNKLLLSMTNEVGDIVLRENFLQAQSISVSESRSLVMVKELMRFIHWLEKEEKLDRELEFLPDDEELLERQAQGKGLTRAEIAVLIAYGKMLLKEELCCPEVSNEPFYQRVLVDYFPKPIRNKFAKKVDKHPLKDEIIAMRLANEMLDYLGSNFAFRAMDETGASPADVAASFTLTKEIYGMADIWAQIEKLGHKVSAETQHLMIYQTQRMVRRSTRWFLRHRSKHFTIQSGIEYFQKDIQVLQKNIHKVLEKKEKQAILKESEKFIEQGVPKKLAEKISYLSSLFSALDIIEMAKETGKSITLVAEVYFKLGAKLELHWFLEQINSQPVDNHWQAFARAAFREDLDWQQKSLTVAVLLLSKNASSAEESISNWAANHAELLYRWEHMLADFRTSKRHEFAKFSVVLKELLILVESSRALV